jgi:hypothetical protein
MGSQTLVYAYSSTRWPCLNHHLVTLSLSLTLELLQDCRDGSDEAECVIVKLPSDYNKLVAGNEKKKLLFDF